MAHSTTLERQALLFGSYIIGRRIDGVFVQRYIKTMSTTPRLTTADKKVLDFATNHPWSIGLLDGGLAITNPHAELRRRLFIMFALLEAAPDYCQLFLPCRRGLSYLPIIGLSGIRAIYRAVVGIILLKGIGV